MLEVQSFTFNPFQENTYVLRDEGGHALIIDPGCCNAAERGTLQSYIVNNNLTVQGIVCTHCHIDHVLGLKWAADFFGKTPLIPKGEASVLKMAARTAELYELPFDGIPEVDYYKSHKYLVGKEELSILEVPGHSPAHVALYHAPSGILISGDVLFYRSIGRTDLPGGDLNTLMSSIRRELFTLPDATKVYPGHMQMTTIGAEKLHNPFLN